MARGSIWKNKKIKKFKNWVALGSYAYINKHDRVFVLTNQKSGKTRTYESHEAAREHGWVIA